MPNVSGRVLYGTTGAHRSWRWLRFHLQGQERTGRRSHWRHRCQQRQRHDFNGRPRSDDHDPVAVDHANRRNAIKAQFGGGVNATIRITTLADTVSASTSRGSRRIDAGAKPDISAPGTNIISTGMGTGNQPATISGTSMATLHIAGSMALLRQLHPDWSVAELKALIMNTANHDL